MKSPAALRKAKEVERRKAAGEIYLQKWIPAACRSEIEAAIDQILQHHETTNPTRKETE